MHFLLAAVLTAGNLVSWSTNSQNEITFQCQTGAVTLAMLDTHVARVRYGTNDSFIVIRQWPRPPMRVTDGERLVVRNNGLWVEASKKPFRLTFRNVDGAVLLAETNAMEFVTAPDEQFYGLGLVLGEPLSYRGRTRSLYNSRTRFEGGAMTDMAVPLMVSSRGYGVFVDNTFWQGWSFHDTWSVKTGGGAIDYYFIAGTKDQVLDRYTQMTGRSPIPPRWTLGYTQSKFGYRNWGEVYSVCDSFRTNDLPCDGIVLDLYWFGRADEIGKLTWDETNFPAPASNIALLAKSGMKLMTIHEPYINTNYATANYSAAKSLGYLVNSTNGPGIVQNGLFGTLAYFDYTTPAARGWWFEKIRPLVNAGVAAHWTDLGEPEQDHPEDTVAGGRRMEEIHNVYNLLWHRALAEGYATNFPNQRLFMLSRSGFAGDQRFGAAHWSNDVRANWPTLAAHPTALCNYSLSGMSYFGSDVGGFFGVPSDELYIRWFQFGAFCPVFRAHGVDKPVAPYEFSPTVLENCRAMLKLRYRMLPYIYNAARETFETGLPICRALPLAFPDDPTVVTNGSEYMFGPDLLVAPVTTEGATSRSVYLPAGKWIDHWSGQILNGPVTTNWPAALAQIPLFYRDNTIIPFGPAVQSSQFDDGTQRGLRIYCSTNATVTLYDDDGISNGYLQNQFAKTYVTATRSNDAVTVRIFGARGDYPGKPTKRTWNIAVFNDHGRWVTGEFPDVPTRDAFEVTVPLHPPR
jgi:alpha-glucosidase (family GH31 glycosyl hydrolase)